MCSTAGRRLASSPWPATKNARPSRCRRCLPGRPVPPWPAAVPGEPSHHLCDGESLAYSATSGLAGARAVAGQCCLTQGPERPLPGSGRPPAEDTALASWLPLLPGLSPHGLRHGHQTWMDEAGISDALRAERMGHELPGMRGIYSHVSPAMRADLKSVLQELWLSALRERAAIAANSSVRLLNDLLSSAARVDHPGRLGFPGAFPRPAWIAQLSASAGDWLEPRSASCGWWRA